MVKEDWIVRNWDFLKARRMVKIPYQRLERMWKDSGAPTTGKFYGTEEFFTTHYSKGVIGYNGSRRLSLRPYISAPMPEEHVKAVYIDPKKYVFDTQGNIISLESSYEVPIFVFVD